MISKYILFPYYLVLKIRNWRYDRRNLKLVSAPVPVISIGNITAGGTGKTPMTELVVRILSERCRVAVISRGYKRKSRGFLTVETDSDVARVGDEPLQIKRKFPDVTVVVDANRIRAISKLMELSVENRPEVIVLDDGFQYRKLKKDREILLQNHNRPIFKDELIPLGRLRDIPSQIRRADIVISTKSPEYLDEWEREKLHKLTKVRASQPHIFSKIRYCDSLAVFPELADSRYLYSKEVYFFSGIANDKDIIWYLSTKYSKIFHKSFRDHHFFTKMDVVGMKHFVKNNPLTLLLTTEKDAMRLQKLADFPKEVAVRLFYLPIEVQFLTEGERELFTNYLMEVFQNK